MSDTEGTPTSGNWKMPKYEPGADELWDRLGEDWQAVDGIHPGARVYVRWRTEAGARPVVTGFCAAGDITTDVLRAVPVSRLENLRVLLDQARSKDDFLAELVPLTRHKGEAPEEFSNRVAYYYRIFAASSSSPTKDLAEHSGVPLPTVRGWIREARLRGLLPPGTRGKAG
ncbi:hypothetical protein F8568_017735 [Actinomadura sp. LD22]|uniref:Uncharacterized protein n=1 Tax=Actinomadura physcomitrii TaxID=2650748 RepID=A0A6I4M914_9ACTN|nr:hypothetical protein [Actinomadura physcomitrii]MWA02183.1 hypothetical protein [Actinomadura physcomitrii]